MFEAPVPHDEMRRLEALQALCVLDTASEERFDRLTRMAQRLFNVPAAAVTFVDRDRQWCKSVAGSWPRNSPRRTSLCAHSILGAEVLVVEDLAEDIRFHDADSRIGTEAVRFYAACPLHAANGARIGTLCIVDTAPRVFSARDRTALRDLAELVNEELLRHEQAAADEPTNLLNLQGFLKVAQQTLVLCARNHDPASLLLLELQCPDDDDDQNDHSDLLRETAELLRVAFRDSDVIARTSQAEFCVLLSGACTNGATRSLERLESQLASRNRIAGKRNHIAVKAGLAAAGDGARHGPSELIAAARSRVGLPVAGPNHQTG